MSLLNWAHFGARSPNIGRTMDYKVEFYVRKFNLTSSFLLEAVGKENNSPQLIQQGNPTVFF